MEGVSRLAAALGDDRGGRDVADIRLDCGGRRGHHRRLGGAQRAQYRCDQLGARAGLQRRLTMEVRRAGPDAGMTTVATMLAIGFTLIAAVAMLQCCSSCTGGW